MNIDELEKTESTEEADSPETPAEASNEAPAVEPTEEVVATPEVESADKESDDLSQDATVSLVVSVPSPIQDEQQEEGVDAASPDPVEDQAVQVESAVASEPESEVDPEPKDPEPEPVVEAPAPEEMPKPSAPPSPSDAAPSDAAASDAVAASDEPAPSNEPVVALAPVAETPVVEEAAVESEEEEEEEEDTGVLPELDPARAALPWYVVHTYSGYEMRVKLGLEERVRAANLIEKFGHIVVPEEKIVELVRGEKKTSSRKVFPGYILVQCDLDEETWHLVKATPKVTGFIGDSVNPTPLSSQEVEALLLQMQGGAQRPRPSVEFDQGDAIKVIDGPFADFNGTVDEVKPDKGKLRVLISIFGRNTPVELDFVQVEKV